MGQFFANRALARQGRLLEAMFAFPQIWGTHGLVLNYTDTADYGRRAMYNSDLWYELGHANAAYRLAYNQTTLVGETYANLKRIAECTMLNGSYEIAAKCLGILERTLFHRDFARRYQRLLADPQAADRFFAEARAHLPTVELDINLGEYAGLLALVDSNPRNRAALDYLTAWCLLDKTLVPVVASRAGQFAEAGYSALPVHVQEAMMVWQSATGASADPRVVGYGRDTMQRFERFGEQLERLSDRDTAERALRADYGGTYMYYFVLTTTPLEGTPAASWLRLGNELFSQGRRSEAGIYYEQARLKQPESAAAGVYLGDPSAPPGAWSGTPGALPERGLQLRSHY
jgi:tetratricopeptide (TPR) repeat protein